MNADALAALRGSIPKWEAIVAGTGVDEGHKNCRLCAVFRDDDCRGCPVQERTGRPNCRSTPYEAFTDVATYHSATNGLRAETPEAKAAAQRELDFLRSLLPPEDV